MSVLLKHALRYFLNGTEQGKRAFEVTQRVWRASLLPKAQREQGNDLS